MKPNPFATALAFTAVPLIVIGVASAATSTAGGALGPVFAVESALWVLAVLVGIGFAIARKGQIASGVLTGAAIGLVGVGLNCFAGF